MTRLTKKSKFVFIAIAAAMLFTVQAFAQSITPVADTTTGEPTVNKSPFKIDVGYSHRIKTDIKGGSGSFNVQSTGVKASNHLQLNPCYTLDTALDYEYNIYQMQNNNHRWFRRANRFDWNKVHLVTLTSMLTYQRDEKLSFYGGPVINMGTEEGASIGRAFSGGAAGGVNYVFSPTLTAGAGLAVVSRIEDPVATVPLVRLDWMFAEKWNLHAGFSDLGSSAGYGMEVSWNPIEKLTVSSGVQEQYKRFRLSDNNDRRHGRYAPVVASDKFAVAYAKACYDVTKNIGVEGYAGMAFDGKLKVENRNGKALAEEDYDQTPMFGLRTSFAF